MPKQILQDAILGSANYAIISTTAAGVVMTFNATAERWLGYTAAEIVGKVTPALWHDADEVVARAKVLAHELGRTIEPGFEVFTAKPQLGQMDNNEWTLIRKDGSRFPALLSVTTLTDDAGGIIGFLGVIDDISEHLSTQASLRESEERMRLATDAAGIAVWAWDVKGGAIHWDAQMFAIYGIPPKPGGWVAYEDWSSRVLPEDRAEQEAQLQRTVAACGRSQREFRITRGSDNAVRFIQAAEMVSVGADGKAVRVVGINLDITERKRASAMLQESKRFLQSTLDALSSHIAILDEHGTIIEVNAAWNRFASANAFMGSRRGVGDNYLQLCDSASGRFSEEAPMVASGIRAVIAGQSDGFELEYPCHSAREQRWFIVRATRFVGDGNVRVVIAHENITTRKRAEVALQESEQRYRSLFENMIEGYAYCRLIYEQNQPVDFIYLAVNDVFESLTGLKDVIGKKVSELIPGIRETDPELLESYSRVALTGKTEKYEIYLKPLGFWFAVSVYSPEKEHFVTVFDNITDRKQHEAEREKLITELQTALAEVKTLSGMIPICGWCKKVRSDQGYWQSVEQYVGIHSDATFSHGMCPECAKLFKADILKNNPT